MVQKKVDYPYSDVEAVVKSLSRKDYKLISPRGRYIDSPYVVYRDVAFKDDIPIGFIEGYLFNSDLKRMILVAAVHPQYRKQNGFTMTSINDAQRVYQLEPDVFKAMQVHLSTKKKQ